MSFDIPNPLRRSPGASEKRVPGAFRGLAIRGAAALVLTFGLATAGVSEARADDHGPGAERVEVGQQAPDFDLKSSAGDSYSLGQLSGGEKHLVMVFFRGTW